MAKIKLFNDNFQNYICGRGERGSKMRLTVKNIREALKEHESCPFCGGEAEICAYPKGDGSVVKIICADDCGASANFVEWLVELEQKPVQKGDGVE